MTVTSMPPATDQAPEAKAETTKDSKPKKSRKKLLVVAVALLALGAGGWWFTRPAPSGPPQPGNVVKLDPVQINLTSEHYLRIGIALQLVKGAAEADGSKALDATIGIYSGRPMSEVNDPKHRVLLKKELERQLSELYDKDVMGVYFTEYVTQ